MKQIFIVVVALSLVASIYGVTNLEVFGQNSTSSNLTQAAGPGPMTALTQSDFGDLTDNLNSAREALRDNDPEGAVGDLGSAETEVRVFMTQVRGGYRWTTIVDSIKLHKHGPRCVR